jgi:hypothetical protein
MLKKAILLCILFIGFLAHAQSPTFYAQVSKNKVSVGEQFQIAFTLNGPGNNLVYSNLKDFNILAGPMQSQSMSIVNGNMSQSTTISFVISAKKEGKVVIGPASVMANGNQKLETAPITIEVTKGNSSSQSGGQQGGQSENNQYASEISNEDLFVRTFLSKAKCYVGEQITVTQKVYSRVDLRGFQNIKFPPYNGFWSQKEEENKQINLEQENLNGISYYVAEYNKVYLFPQRSGSITIEPVELECIVRRATQRQPRNVFEQFFGSGGYEDVAIKIKSKPVKVDVKELPTENKPEGFTGAVGNFSYKTEISKDQVKANDAINIKMTVSGKGNISLFEAPKASFPESFETYDPKVNETLKTVGGVSGSKTFDYLVIPREKGEFMINDLSFTYFDPEKKEYVKLPSPDIKLTVLEGDGSSAQVIVPSKKGVKETENDIRYIKSGDLNLKKNEDEFFASSLHYVLLILPALLFFGGLLLVKQRIKANSDLSVVKERKAAKMAKKQLAAAEKHMLANHKDQFFNEVLNALHRYISDKLGLPVADLSKDKISEMLLQRNVSDDTRLHLIDTLNTCEYAKYAPASVTGDLKKVYRDTIELISQMENQIRK